MTPPESTIAHPLPVLAELLRQHVGLMLTSCEATGYRAGFFDALAACAARPEEVMASYYDWLRTHAYTDPSAIVQHARELLDTQWQHTTEGRHDYR